ncbi:MAG: PEP-CTERM sorting domain-containing protein [Rhodocyclaceae bacterium]
MNRNAWGALIGAAVLMAGNPAHAATVSFDYVAGGVSVVQGVFSYDDDATGTLGYGDLTDFSITFGPRTYTLADVLGFTDYVWFAYDTLSNSFINGTNLGGFGGGGYSASLAAINATGTSGFFISPSPSGMFRDYWSGYQSSFDGLRMTQPVSTVPEPASLLLTGLALAGLLGMRRKQA